MAQRALGRRARQRRQDRSGAPPGLRAVRPVRPAPSAVRLRRRSRLARLEGQPAGHLLDRSRAWRGCFRVPLSGRRPGSPGRLRNPARQWNAAQCGAGRDPPRALARPRLRRAPRMRVRTASGGCGSAGPGARHRAARDGSGDDPDPRSRPDLGSPGRDHRGGGSRGHGRLLDGWPLQPPPAAEDARMTEIVECTGLYHIYKTGTLEVVALQGLDLKVAEAEMVAVVGRSGSGKTTLMNILAALEPPSAGQARLAGIGNGALIPAP